MEVEDSSLASTVAKSVAKNEFPKIRSDLHSSDFYEAVAYELIDMNGISLERSLRDELINRLVWCFTRDEQAFSTREGWNMCSRLVRDTLRVYLIDSLTDNPTRRFVAGTTWSSESSSSTIRPCGRSTNDFRKAVYVFPDNDLGNQMALGSATLSHIQGIIPGTPTVITLEIRESDFQRLLVQDFRTYDEPETILAGIARQYDTRAIAFATSVAHIFNHFDCIASPFTKWTLSGWRQAEGDQFAFRSEYSRNLLTVEKVTTVEEVFSVSDDSLAAYTRYWTRLARCFVDGDAGVKRLVRKWEQYAGLPSFAHEHPLYYSVPEMLPRSVWRELSVEEKLELVDRLLVAVGNRLYPDIPIIQAILSRTN